MNIKDLDLATTEGLIEFHEHVLTKCAYAKHYKGDHMKTQKDNYHYWVSKRKLEKLKKIALEKIKGEDETR